MEKKGYGAAIYNNFKRLSVFFLNVRNRDFGKNYPPTACLNGPTACLNGYVNIAIFYSGFFANQK
jgi:hypothetical protein